MFRSLANVSADVAAAALRAATSLPETLGLISLRELASPMGLLLGDAARLNLLSLEALAVAELLGAELCMATSDDDLRLRGEAEARGRAVRLVEA